MQPNLIIKLSRGLAVFGFSFALLSAAATHAEEKVDFAKQVAPIFEERCHKCHGEKRGLGGLRLHTAELVAALEDDGLVVAGDTESSELYQRLILPADDKKRMPKGGKPLDKAQIEIVKQWIEQGALLTTADAPKPGSEPDHGSESKAEKPAEPSAAPSAEAVEKLQAAGGTVVALYSGSKLLSVGFPSNPSDIDNSIFDLLAPVAENVAWLDLGGTKVTDAGAQKLAAMPNLSRLHLEKTEVTDAAIGALTGLAYLEYLNLYGTQITDAAIAELESAPALERLYVWQTEVSFDAAKKLEAAKEGLEVNLGWDHPGVVRERLNKELERVTADKEAAKKETEAAEKQLADAKAKLEASNSRESEIKAELEALNNPKDEAKPEQEEAVEPEEESKPQAVAETKAEEQPEQKDE